jgi:hypothetical protein
MECGPKQVSTGSDAFALQVAFMRKSILLAALALFSATLYAQHGGHVGAIGGGGHSGSSFGGHASGGSFSGAARPAARVSPAYRNFSSAPRSTAYRQSIPRYADGTGANGYHHTDHRRRVGYGVGYSYGYPGYGYVYPGYLNGYLDLDDNDPNDPNNNPNLQNSYVASGYNDDPTGGDPSGDQQQAYDGPFVDPPQYYARPPYNPGGVSADPNAVEQPLVALVFKDGSKLEVKNYVATRTRILVRDPGHNRDILVSALDIPATLAANQAAGVDFSLPGQ